jgi:hypothetical protein
VRQNTPYFSSQESTALRGSGVELVKAVPVLFVFLHQIGVPQQAQMFGYRGS